MTLLRWMPPVRLAAALALGPALSGCAMVAVRSLGPEQYIAMKRGDILSTGQPSQATVETVRVAGLDDNVCARPSLDCIDALGNSRLIDTDRRLATMAELSMQLAIEQTPRGNTLWNDAQFDLWLRAARFSYAYLFYGERSPGERAFEDRQTQVRDYYNYAVQTLSVALFHRIQQTGDGTVAGWLLPVDASSVRFANGNSMPREALPASTLSFAGVRSQYRRDGFGAEIVAVMSEKAAADAVIATPATATASPASAAAAATATASNDDDDENGDGEDNATAVGKFAQSPGNADAAASAVEAAAERVERAAAPQAGNLRDGHARSGPQGDDGNAYPRASCDGASGPDCAHGKPSAASRFAKLFGPNRGPVYSEMPVPSLTLLLRFDGESLNDILHTHVATVVVYDPYRQASVELHGQTVPLAGNFTAGYGLWLARSGFARQSLATLFGRERGIDRPHIYLMQPFDPGRRVILMLHGLASSPEAWVNLANEIQGDATLREHFQIWQVYYPTNVPILLNLLAIRRAFEATLTHFDPDGDSAASHDVVLIGHSMGGVIARLLVSSADDQLWNAFQQEYQLSGERAARVRSRVEPLLEIKPMPQVERAIFIAAPHQGTPFARDRIGRWVSALIRLPATVLYGIDNFVHLATGIENDPAAGKTRFVPNSVDQLRDTDPYIRASAGLPISPKVHYHSIIARRSADGPLEDSTDGVVPYTSAHLPGATSEKVIVSGHSVQETPQAILEIRRILHQDVTALAPTEK